MGEGVQRARDTGPALGLLTDLYELTMAYGHWRVGTADREAAFQLFFREAPFGGTFAIAAGLADALDYLERARFDREDLDYLQGLEGTDGRPLFDPGFLEYLGQFRFACDVDAVPEGTVVFPQEPLLRVQGPLVQAQVVETALLTLINFQTLIATKAARVCEAAQGDPVIEFGLRRAQGVDGGLSASRAAYIGGCAGTSHVLAGRRFGIPVRGTHAHSWVLAFDDETEAFAAYATAMPNNCIFLVDTYDSLEGVRHAVEIGRRLRKEGHRLVGIRLDSGDLASLSIQARRQLDEAGFPDAVIVGSNDLDEHRIAALKQQGARINVWGVGTQLVTGGDQPALGGVYKLSALRRPHGSWEPRAKLSEQAAKTTLGGILQVRRFREGARFVGDAIWDALHPAQGAITVVDPRSLTGSRSFEAAAPAEDLLSPVMRGGVRVVPGPSLHEIRLRTRSQLAMLDPAVRRLVNPAAFPVGWEQGLYERQSLWVAQARKRHATGRSGEPARS